MSDAVPLVGRHFGAWTVARVEGRKALVVCVCGQPRQLSVAALLEAYAAWGCGCMALRRPKPKPPLKDRTAEIAVEEMRSARKRQWGDGR